MAGRRGVTERADARVPLLTGAAGLLLLAIGCRGVAAEAPTLPEPLTLEFALSLADDPHPDLLVAAAERDIAQARRALAESANGINASFNAAARYIEPSQSSSDQSNNDSQAGFLVRKQLYDFGHTRARVAAADALLDSRHLRYADVRLQRGVTILERYLDVLLADLEFRVQDEAMAIAYVRMDRMRDQHELKQVSDVDRLTTETRYQEARSARFSAQARQRTTRVRLADALNRPGQLSSILAEPPLQSLEREVPDLEELITEVLRTNPPLQALRAETEAAREQMRAARALGRPVISAAAEANEFQREVGSREPWSVGVEVEVPLYTGGRTGAERAEARAALRRSEAELAGAELELREVAQTLWEEIQVLRASREESRTRVEYRELFLDRSRALYEMEVNANLGDAMVFSSEARLREAELDYRLLLSWARLDVLRGRPVLTAAMDVVQEEER